MKSFSSPQCWHRWILCFKTSHRVQNLEWAKDLTQPHTKKRKKKQNTTCLWERAKGGRNKYLNCTLLSAAKKKSQFLSLQPQNLETSTSLLKFLWCWAGSRMSRGWVQLWESLLRNSGSCRAALTQPIKWPKSPSNHTENRTFYLVYSHFSPTSWYRQVKKFLFLGFYWFFCCCYFQLGVLPVEAALSFWAQKTHSSPINTKIQGIKWKLLILMKSGTPEIKKTNVVYSESYPSHVSSNAPQQKFNHFCLFHSGQRI